MENEKISFEKTGQFTKLFLDYINKESKLKPFFSLYPCIENFRQQLNRKGDFSEDKRIALFDVLKEQYKGLENIPYENIKSLLDKNTYTVTTGHQLNIFTGPLYFIYKIITTINLAKELKTAYPKYNFVPVYWMATEDHDFEEISYFRLFGNKYSWEHPNPRGTVGRLSTEGLNKILDKINEMPDFFKTAYTKFENLANATRYYVNKLFAQEGLVILDADHPKLKSSFVNVIKDDLTCHSSKKLINETNQNLKNLGYKAQIFSRDINFFFLENNLRERIEKQGDDYKVLNSNISFTEKELINAIKTTPEKFSPNVVLRPLYQETVLPNLAYIGGPAEVIYWLQIKSIFENFNTEFPILVPRNFALVVNKSIAKRMDKLKISSSDIFLETDTLKSKFLKENAKVELDLQNEKLTLKTVFSEIKSKVRLIDKSLEGFIGAEENKVLKRLNNIEKRLQRAEEKNQETAVKQLIAVKEKLFSKTGIQERTENFMSFYLNDPKFICEVLNSFKPLDYKFNVLRYTD